MWLRRPIGIAIELLAGIPSIIYGIWGLFVFAPFLQQYVQPVLIDTFGNVPGAVDAVRRAALRHRHADRRPDPGDHGAAVHRLDHARRVRTVPPVLKEAAYGLGCTTWEVVAHVVLPYTRVGVIGGVMLGLGRALGETMAVTFVIGNAHRISGLAARARHDDLGDHRQRVHRGGRRSLHLVADRARPDPVRHHLHRARRRARYMLMRLERAGRER